MDLKDSPSVLKYIDILQGIINRMADNSAKCKTWCITLLSALIVVSLNDQIISTEHTRVILWVCIGIAFLFFCLDSYYLSIERQAREKYGDFIKRLNTHDISGELFKFGTNKWHGCRHAFRNLWGQLKTIFMGMISISTLVFYAIVMILILLLIILI